MVANNRTKQILITALATLPQFVAFYVITSYWVNIPFWDQWDISEVFDRYYTDSLSIAFLMERHNEHIIFFPKLITLISGVVSRYDVRFEIILCFALVTATSFNLYILIKKIFDNHVTGLLLVGFTNVFLFSLAHWENWLWGSQYMIFLIPFALTTGLNVNVSSARDSLKLLSAAMCSIVATFSFSTGILLWLLLTPPSIFKNSRRWSLFIVYLSLMCVCVYVTLSGVHHTLHSSNLLNYLKFVMILHGNPFVFGHNPFPLNEGVKITAGAVIFLMTVMALLRSRNGNLYPWFVIGGFSILSSMLIAGGRAGAGIFYAHGSRYVYFASFLPVSISVILVYSALKPGSQKIYNVLVAASLIVACAVSINLSIKSVSLMKIQNRLLRKGKAALQVYKVFYDNNALTSLHPRTYTLIERFNALRKFKLPDVDAVDPQKTVFSDQYINVGFNLQTVRAGKRLMYTGNVDTHSPEIVVIIVCNGITVGTTFVDDGGHFMDVIDGANLPYGGNKLTPLMYDLKTNKIMRAGGDYTLNKSPDGALSLTS